MGGIFHLYLEAVAFHLDFVQIYGIQDLAGVADKACGAVINFYPQDFTHIIRCKVTHHDPSDRPVDYTHAIAVTGTDGKVRPVFCTCLVKANQIIRIM